MELRLDGQVAVITGSSMGIGESIAQLYGEAGARVVVNSRDAGRAAAVADRLKAAGIDALPVAADVSKQEDVQRLFAEVDRHYGQVDVLVNNAGIAMISPSEQLSLEDWRRCIDLNLTGAFLCAQEAGRRMLERRRGVIINVSSIAGRTAIAKRAAYCTSKHGLDGLTEVLAIEWADRGIRVHSLNPAYIDTPMESAGQDAGVTDYTRADIERRTPLGRYGTAEEVAKVALFLASDASAYMTGSPVMVDGGWVAFGQWERR